MTTELDVMTSRAGDLRRAFDLTFSEPNQGVAEATESLLVLRAGGVAYAVRLAEITGLFADRTIVRLPSPVAEFLGVAGLRHDVVPIYSLRALLGHARAGEPPRWLITARAVHVMALAFERFEGYRRVPLSAVVPSRHEAASAHVPDVVRLADGLRGVVSIGSLIETIEGRIPRIGTAKEQ